MSVDIKTEEEVILENAEYNSAEELEEELHLQLDDSGGESYHIQYQTETGTTTETPQHIRQRGSSTSMNTSGTGGAVGKSASGDGGGGTNKNLMESEKRLRREIANSNERRRMQSINAGFQNLRQLLPQQEGEKLSKAAILQQTSQYIIELENDKTQLLAQNSQLKRQLGQHESSSAVASDAGQMEGGGSNVEPISGVAVKKRKLADNIINIQTISDSSDEGLGSMSPEPMTLLNAGQAAQAVSKSQINATIIAHTTKELSEVKKQLDKERRLRSLLEEELSAIKRQLYSVATAPTTSVGTTTFIPREVIEHTDNLVRDHLVDELPPGSVSYVEIDENGQQQVVVCSSIEELEHEDDVAAADIITEDAIHEEVILSSTSSTESETEVSVNAIAKAYAEGKCPNNVNGGSTTALQPILQAAIKATPKVEVERINEAVMKVKMEKIDQPIGLNRSRQNLETIVEAIRHLEGDHLFGEVLPEHKQSQDAPLALTTKQAAQAQRITLAELRPFLQLKQQLTIVGGSSGVGGVGSVVGGGATTIKAAKLQAAKDGSGGSSATPTVCGGGATTIRNLRPQSSAQVTPTTLYKVQTSGSGLASASDSAPQQITITTSALKQCRPGVIVAKQHS